MSTKWYYSSSSVGQVGPLSASEMKRLALSGKIKPDTFVRKGEDGEWVLAQKIKGFVFEGDAIDAKSLTVAEPDIVLTPVDDPVAGAGKSDDYDDDEIDRLVNEEEEERICSYCKKRIGEEGIFTSYPGLHVHSYQYNPVTGECICSACQKALERGETPRPSLLHRIFSDEPTPSSPTVQGSGSFWKVFLTVCFGILCLTFLLCIIYAVAVSS